MALVHVFCLFVCLSVFFSMISALDIGDYFDLKTHSIMWILHVLTNRKTLNLLTIIVYLHIHSHHFGVEVWLKFVKQSLQGHSIRSYCDKFCL